MIRHLVRIPILVALGVLLVSGSSFAATHEGKAKDQKSTQAQDQKSPMVKGRIMDKKEVSLKDTDKKNLVVLLKTDDGRRIAVDLGATQNLKDIEIKKDQNVSVQGRMARVGDRPVLFADRLVLAGKTIEIDQAAAMKQAKTRQTQAKAREISGEVTRTKQVAFKGKDMKHTVVLMNTAKGHTMAVDLGPTQNLQQVDVKKGEKISVHGKPAMMGDRLVFLANRLEADGKTVEIKRMEQKKEAA